MRNNCGAIGLRVLTGLALIATVACLTWIPTLSFGFTLFIALLAALGTGEYYSMAKKKGAEVERTFGMLASAFVVIAAHWGRFNCVLLVFIASLGILSTLHILRGRHSLTGLAASVFGLLYIGLGAAQLVFLHSFLSAKGPLLVTFLVIAVVCSDSGAYFVGSAMGRHKLAPKVSPNKTWEGAVGGVVAAVFGCAVFWVVLQKLNVQAYSDTLVWHCAIIGGCLAVAAQLGDLTESMLKRDAGVKDSGTIFPGHGGVLDRCDGFLFAAPTLFFIQLFIAMTTS